MTPSDEEFMRRAIDRCRAGIAAGQSPFGACIVSGMGEVIACDHNRVFEQTDVTAHGEVVTLREACRGTGELSFPGATIYSTCEPCPMCFSAIHWAGIGRIVFGASIDDAAGLGFRELPIPNTEMARLGGSPIEVIGGVLRAECLDLFREYHEKVGRYY